MQNDEKYLLFVEYNDRIISAVYRLQEKKTDYPGTSQCLLADGTKFLKNKERKK